MAKHKILVSRVVHTPGGFLVFNAGETADVPAEHVDTFRADGNIGGAADVAAPAAQAPRAKAPAKARAARKPSTRKAKAAPAKAPAAPAPSAPSDAPPAD